MINLQIKIDQENAPTDSFARKSTVLDRLRGKFSKEEANYRAGKDKIVCFECRYYLNPGQESSNCSKVAGLIEAQDVCDYFEVRDI